MEQAKPSAAELPPISAADAIREARNHLGAAIAQMLSSDDAIICNHVRQAAVLLSLIDCRQG